MSIRVTGPKALMQSDLVPQGLTVFAFTPTREIAFAGKIAEFDAIADALAGTGEVNGFVLVSRDEEGTIKEVAPDLLALADTIPSVHCLDIIVQRGDRYWSAMCPGEDCCPPEGRQVPPSKSAVDVVLADLTSGVEPSKFDLVVNEVTLRDKLLVEADARNLWSAIVTLTKSDESAQAWSVRACAYYAMGDFGAAQVSAEAAQAAGGTSLADLILRGVRMGAPAEMFLESLRAAGRAMD